MDDYYVVLTGSRGNSGDDLIKYSSFKLFEEFRKDRGVLNFNAWEELDDEKLSLINKGKALILLGGPALRYDTYPGVYPLRKDLEDIKVPIVVLGIGYRDQNGEWNNTSKFYLSKKTKLLLNKVANSGLMSAVRDFHTLNVLLSNGYHNFLMAGCPAMYNTKYIGEPFLTHAVTKIAFATGRMYLRSKSMFDQQIKVILDIRKAFPDKTLTVVFHDPIDPKVIQTSEFIKQMKQYAIPFEDISGSAKNLMNFYSDQHIQIGYRVHAHIYMCSINKPSLLLNEDGRGKGMKTVLNGLILDAYHLKNIGPLDRLKIKFGLSNINDVVVGEDRLSGDVIRNLQYEIEQSYPRISRVRPNIDFYFSTFKDVILKLP